MTPRAPSPLRLWLAAALATAFFAQAASAASIEITVQGGDQTLEHLPVKVNVALPKDHGKLRAIRLKDAAGNEVIGQFAEPGLLAQTKPANEGEVVRELHFILPRLERGAAVQLSGELRQARLSAPTFRWENKAGKYAELRLGVRPVLRYMYEAVDNSSPQRREETYKIYHHLYDPKGQRLVTKGPGGLFPHHRGVFYGFNRITYGDGKTADVWHCRQGESQTHEDFLAVEEGPVLGRHRAAIAWRGKDGEVFAREQRELTAYNTPGGVLIEFASRLASADGKVVLDGDPQHAGFQFRASQEVPDKTAKLTYYLRPDGKGNPGEFRNWPQHKEHVNLPWHALSFVLGDRRYTCLYLDHPQNPKEARFSERDYGRFGSYFEAEIEGDKTLDVRYRLWLQEGEMTVEQAAAHSAKFVDPPPATAKIKP